MTYEEQLADPRWQQRRIEIYKRDKFTCQLCSHYFHNLHVHHIRYTGLAWEAPDKDLITLCGLCHAKIHRKTHFFFVEYGPWPFARSVAEILPGAIQAMFDCAKQLANTSE